MAFSEYRAAILRPTKHLRKGAVKYGHAAGLWRSSMKKAALHPFAKIGVI